MCISSNGPAAAQRGPRARVKTLSMSLGLPQDSNWHRHELGGEVIDLRARATYPDASLVTAEPHLNLAPVLKMGFPSQFRYG